MIEQYISAKELSQKLAISRSAVFALVRKGYLPSGILIGGSRRWAVDDIQGALSAMKQKGGVNA